MVPDGDIQLEEKVTEVNFFPVTYEVSSSLLFAMIVTLMCGRIVLAGLLTAQTCTLEVIKCCSFYQMKHNRTVS